MTSVNLIIDGQRVTAPGGSTVLRAAQAAGINVPTLCDHPALAPIGACRVCLVEIKGQRVLQPACTYPVSEGMEVQTETPAVVQSRKFVLDLLFSERNHYCMFCEMSGDCELQDLGYRYGLDHWVYPTYRKAYPVDATRQAFLMDHNRCILCRRCVRACGELVANHTLGERERGSATMICADMNVAFGESTCVSCGTCLQVCPTGALVDKRSAFMGRNVQTEPTKSTCAECSVGCGMVIVARGGSVLRVEGDWDAQPNGGLLCQKGRFAPLFEDRARVTHPMVRRDGQLTEVSWDEALSVAGKRLKSTPADKVGVLASTQATNEALYLVGALFREMLGVRSVGLVEGAVPLLLDPQGTLADLAESDLVLVVGADPVADHPVASFLIKRTADRGVTLIVVGEENNGLAPFANMLFGAGEVRKAVEVAGRAQRPLVLYGPTLTVEGAWSLQTLHGARFIALEPGVNARGALGFGLNRVFRADKADAIYVLAGEDGAGAADKLGGLAQDAFVVAEASYQSPLLERADVVLPAAIWAERSGTLTNLEGRVLEAHQVIVPAGSAKPDWEILALLGAELGAGPAASMESLTALAKQELAR
jgi:formate dehydrogenase major subunit